MQRIDLKPNGRNIPVTEANKMEYIRLFADYYVNQQVGGRRVVRTRIEIYADQADG